MITKISILITTLFFSFSLQAQNTFFVSDTSPENGNGLSWSTAFNSIHDAVNASLDNDEIWIKMGDTIINPFMDSTIIINKRLTIRGGFNGTETTLQERNQGAKTVLNAIVQNKLLINDTLNGAFLLKNNVILEGLDFREYKQERFVGSQIISVDKLLSLEMENCSFLNNDSKCVLMQDSCNAIINNVNIKSHRDICFDLQNGTISISNSNFENTDGGQILWRELDFRDTSAHNNYTEFDNCQFLNCNSILAYDPKSSVNVSNCDFVNPISFFEAYYGYGGQTFHVSDCKFYADNMGFQFAPYDFDSVILENIQIIPLTNSSNTILLEESLLAMRKTKYAEISNIEIENAIFKNPLIDVEVGKLVIDSLFIEAVQPERENDEFIFADADTISISNSSFSLMNTLPFQFIFYKSLKFDHVEFENITLSRTGLLKQDDSCYETFFTNCFFNNINGVESNEEIFENGSGRITFDKCSLTNLSSPEYIFNTGDWDEGFLSFYNCYLENTNGQLSVLRNEGNLNIYNSNFKDITEPFLFNDARDTDDEFKVNVVNTVIYSSNDTILHSSPTKLLPTEFINCYSNQFISASSTNNSAIPYDELYLEENSDELYNKGLLIDSLQYVFRQDFNGNPRVSFGNIDIGYLENQNLVTSLNNNSESETFVYPNPFQDVLHLKDSGSAIVKILSVSGNIIFTATQEKSNQVINTSELEKGLYVLKITQNGVTTTQRITKL